MDFFSETWDPEIRTLRPMKMNSCSVKFYLELTKVRHDGHAIEVKEPKKEMKYLDIASAANFLGLSRAQLYIMMRDGKLPYTHVGRQRRLIMSDIVSYVKKGYQPARKSII